MSETLNIIGFGPNRQDTLWRGMLRAAFVVLLALVASASPEDNRKEMEVKGAFVLKFLSYTEWPESKHASETSHLLVGVLGANPFGKGFDARVGKVRIGKRKVTARYGIKLDDLKDCHAVFVPKEWKGKWNELVSESTKQNVMLVGEKEGFSVDGGTINFYLHESKLRFEINLAASKRAKLKINANLLKVARIVTDKKR